MLFSSITSPPRPRTGPRTRGRAAAGEPSRDHATSVIDLHCHLLPGIDDGPRDLATTLTMAQLQVEAGVTTVATTPHVSWDLPNDAATIARRLGDVRAALSAAKIPLELVGGAEIDVHQASELPDDELHRLALGGGRWLLVEAPLQRALPLEPVVYNLLDRGHLVLIAHPERSPAVQRDPASLARLAAAGVLTQITASSLVGRFGRSVQRFAERLLDEGLAHTLASDAHDPKRRPPGMREPAIAAGIGDLLPLLSAEIPSAILSGDRIPALPKPRRRGLRGFLGSGR